MQDSRLTSNGINKFGVSVIRQLLNYRNNRKRRAAMARADAARDLGDQAGAARLYAQVAAAFPANAAAWGQLGNMSKDLGRYDEAERAYDAVRALRPLDPDIHLQSGHLAKLRGDIYAAIAHYRVSLQLDPAQRAAAHELAELGIWNDAALDERAPNLNDTARTIHRRLTAAHMR